MENPPFRLAVVIPAYNESATIRSVASAALTFAPVVIVVDDCSTDGTSAAVEGTGAIVLRNRENFGKAKSVWRGISHATSFGVNWIITMDGDGQHNPEDIPRFASAAAQFSERIIIGSRMGEEKNFPKARLRANRFANFWVSWAAGFWVEDSQSGFRLYPIEFLEKARITADGFTLETQTLIEAGRLGYRVKSIPIAAIYSPSIRPSHFRPVMDIARITIMVGWWLIKGGWRLGNLWRAMTQKGE